MKLRSRHFLGLFLSAVVLAGGMLPPGLRHSHADAGRPHGHHADEPRDDQHADHHPGPDHRDHHHPDPHRLEPGLAADSGHKLHTHLELFGFDLTIPDAPEGEDSRSDRSVDQAGTLVRLVDERLPDPGRALQWVDGLALASELPCPRDVPAPAPIVALPPPGTSPPLCEAARHERSGVLLT